MMPTLLLTGARGLIGDAVLRHCYSQGWRIIVACSGAMRGIDDRGSVVSFNLGAVNENGEFERILEGADALIHCSSIRASSRLLETSAGARELYAKNVQGTYDLMDLAARLQTKAFIFLSSVNLYHHAPETITENIP